MSFFRDMPSLHPHLSKAASGESYPGRALDPQSDELRVDGGARGAIAPMIRLRGHFVGSDILVHHVGEAFDLAFVETCLLGPRFICSSDFGEEPVPRAGLLRRSREHVMQYWNTLEVEWRSRAIALISSSSVPASSLLACPAYWSSTPFKSLSSIAIIVPDVDVVVAFDASIAGTAALASGLAEQVLQTGDAPLSPEILRMS